MEDIARFRISLSRRRGARRSETVQRALPGLLAFGLRRDPALHLHLSQIKKENQRGLGFHVFRVYLLTSRRLRVVAQQVKCLFTGCLGKSGFPPFPFLHPPKVAV